MGAETPFVIVLVFFSVVCHEIAHGFLPLRLGDPTAWRMGRLTFNPVSHIDPIGTVVLPALLLITGSPFLLAWAKPVPVDPRYFRNPRKGMMLVGLAGPVTNLVIALAMTGLLHLAGGMLPAVVVHTFAMVALMNVLLAFFNLIPVPPLDGSRIVAFFLRGGALRAYAGLERYGIFIVFGLLWLGVVSSILSPFLDFAVRHLGLFRFPPLSMFR